MIEKPRVLKIDQTGMNSFQAGGGINLYDCLNYFSVEETLRGDDKWYCSKCKDHVVASKKMEVYKAPEFLIVHLKRFSHNRNTMFGTRKLGDLIDFPVEGLDMSNYIVQSRGGDGSQKIKKYDLYAVSNHFGSLSGGHYTAYAKNSMYNKWYNFDDSDVMKASSSEVVTKAAYVLFYRLRK